MDVAALKPDSFCTVFDMLAPEYFDTPADFIAYVRAVELPRSLHIMSDQEGEIRQAESYLSLVDGESHRLAEATIAATDAALAKANPTAADAEAVIAAFNALFGRQSDAQFIAWGDVTAVFSAARIRDRFDAWSESVDELDDDEPELMFKRLVDEGEFDAHQQEHFDLVCELLSGFPEC